MKIKNSIFHQNIRDTEKMLETKIVYFKQIYNFGIEQYLNINTKGRYKSCSLLKKTFSEQNSMWNTKKMLGTNLVNFM